MDPHYLGPLGIVHSGSGIYPSVLPLFPTPSLFRDPFHQRLLAQEVQSLLWVETVEEAPLELRGWGFYSHYFLIPKASSDLRLILDLRNLKRFMKNLKFCMVSLPFIIPSLYPGDWYTALDLKNAYFHIAVFQGHRRYFRFVVNYKNGGRCKTDTVNFPEPGAVAKYAKINLFSSSNNRIHRGCPPLEPGWRFSPRKPIQSYRDTYKWPERFLHYHSEKLLEASGAHGILYLCSTTHATPSAAPPILARISINTRPTSSGQGNHDSAISEFHPPVVVRWCVPVFPL